MDISVVIPAYNEESRLGGTLERVAAYFERRGIAWEAVVSDDGSRDGTAAVVRRFRADCAAVRLVRSARRRGKGAAVAAGVGRSTGRWVLISDADLSTPIEQVERLWAMARRGIDVVIGSRAVEGAEIGAAQPWPRAHMGRLFNRMLRGLLPLTFRDTQCGFKLFRGPLARRLFRALETAGFAFDVEILLRARAEGATIRELPVAWSHVPRSRVRLGRDGLTMLIELIRIRRSMAAHAFQPSGAVSAAPPRRRPRRFDVESELLVALEK